MSFVVLNRLWGLSYLHYLFAEGTSWRQSHTLGWVFRFTTNFRNIRITPYTLYVHYRNQIIILACFEIVLILCNNLIDFKAIFLLLFQKCISFERCLWVGTISCFRLARYKSFNLFIFLPIFHFLPFIHQKCIWTNFIRQNLISDYPALFLQQINFGLSCAIVCLIVAQGRLVTKLDFLIIFGKTLHLVLTHTFIYFLFFLWWDLFNTWWWWFLSFHMFKQSFLGCGQMVLNNCCGSMLKFVLFNKCLISDGIFGWSRESQYFVETILFLNSFVFIFDYKLQTFRNFLQINRGCMRMLRRVAYAEEVLIFNLLHLLYIFVDLIRHFEKYYCYFQF